MPLAPGEEFVGYTIKRKLGSGGIGEVYLAQHPRLPRQEALKILRAEFETVDDGVPVVRTSGMLGPDSVNKRISQSPSARTHSGQRLDRQGCSERSGKDPDSTEYQRDCQLDPF